jgi:hypothetical protein
MLCQRNLEMRRIVVSRPTHQWRPFRSLAAAIRSSRIVEVPRFEDTLRTGPAASLVPERDRCRRLNDAWPLAISRTALTHPANRLRIRLVCPARNVFSSSLLQNSYAKPKPSGGVGLPLRCCFVSRSGSHRQAHRRL